MCISLKNTTLFLDILLKSLQAFWFEGILSTRSSCNARGYLQLFENQRQNVWFQNVMTIPLQFCNMLYMMHYTATWATGIIFSSWEFIS